MKQWLMNHVVTRYDLQRKRVREVPRIIRLQKVTQITQYFLRASPMLKHVIAIGLTSVRPSVCLSVTRLRNDL